VGAFIVVVNAAAAKLTDAERSIISRTNRIVANTIISIPQASFKHYSVGSL
jgi:hypothetical protein